MPEPSEEIPVEVGKVGYCRPPVNRQFGQPEGNKGSPGRPTAGASVAEWYNAMGDYNLADLQAVIEDPESTNAKAAAAHQWLQAREGKLAALVEVCDRTDGTSTRNMNVRSQVTHVKRVVVHQPARN